MKNNFKLGAVLSVLGIIAGLLLFYFLANTYNTVIDIHVGEGRSDEGNTVRIVYAVLGWWGTAAGALWAAVLYGFLKRENWAWFWGATAATIQLLAGFFPMIPALDGGLPTPTLVVFILAAVLWFGMLFIGGIPKRIITLTFIAGLAYVLTFIDGVAPISKYQTSQGFWNGVYAISQQVNWWGAAAWAVFILAVFKRKPWAIPVGIFAASMSIIGGYPMGINNVFEVQRFSMFLPAPIISTGLLIYLLLSSTQRMFEAWNAEER
ncbi:MAG TPA: hypothetical protein PK152_01640 [Anaerolineales bacterium]|nr:hypothetical protein [Anaerolineales bacterium]HRK87806.1 hypothetical protein [Anaerolineales bacterium]